MTRNTATPDVIKQYERYVMDTYVRSPLVITKGKGSRVWDVEGHEYLDLFPGWGVSLVGYSHPWVMRAVRGQSTRILHVSNNYYHPLQWKAAKKLVEVAFDGKVFFGNSGAEVVESAIKLARRWGEGRHEILVMEQSFHGRTMGALSATGQAKYQQGFAPLLPGFIRVPLNDLDAVTRAVTSQTCAILVEPIQGEGGVRVASEAFLRGLRALCDERRLLLIMDEIQTGVGRTGTWFAYQPSGITPDVLLLAKGLGGGFPIAAMVAKRDVANVLAPGTHGTTFGGSPLGCACVLAVVEAIERQELLARVNLLGQGLWKRLEAFAARYAFITEVRGRGFMVGMELATDGRPMVDACREQRLLINCTQERVLRLLPALTITKSQLERALGILEGVFTANQARAPRAASR